jgi:nucleotide-binding universal stress UspA family protein
MTTVLVAVDASDASVHAVETAHRLFGDDATYLVLNVGGGTYVPVPIFPGEMSLVSPLAWAPVVQSHLAAEDLRNEGDTTDVISDVEAAETIAKQIGKEGGLADATALGIVGDAAGSIIEVAVEHAADVIVVGTHERGWLTRLLTSSVADEVRRESPIPVLAVPRPAGADDDH